MRLKLIILTFFAVLFVILFSSSSRALTAQCSSFTNEVGCENSNCFWCDRCLGKEINGYGTDRCVDNNLQCSYNSCSKTCGANCTVENDCQVNLTETTCFYAGQCNACKCNYRSVDCPKNGTIKDEYGDQACYYGARYCTSSGCSVNRCVVQPGHICDPIDGCIPCEDDCMGDIFVIGKKCVGNDIFAKEITYACYGGQCNTTRNEVLLEKCKAGCENAKCNDERCNINGINTNCNIYDGYYGDSYCKGNDIYKGYRDYRCGTNECVYINTEIKQTSCDECQSGRCFNSGVVVAVNGSSGGTVGGTSGETVGGTNAPNTKLNESSASTLIGGRIFNGFLFGQNKIAINTGGRSGEVKLNVLRSNGVGTLTIEDDMQIIFSTRGIGGFSVSFANNKNLKIYTTSSGWLFFLPAVYDLGLITVSYS